MEVRATRLPKWLSLDLGIKLVLLAAIFGIYAQTAGHSFVNYDDPEYVNDSHVRAGLNVSGVLWAFKSGYSSNSFPLTWISHMLDFQFFGARSGPPHLVNVALHAISTLLLFAVFKRATGAVWQSAMVAGVFALHPLHVESVAWVAERKDVLCAFFLMLTLWAYLRYSERPSVQWYAIVVALFCCGLLSKPMMVTFPFIALLLDGWPLRRFTNEPWSRLFLEKLPFFAIAVGASVVAYLAQEHQGTMATAGRIPLTFRVGNAFTSCFVYLQDFVWPSKLAVFYPYIDLPAWKMVAAALLIAAASAFAILRLRTQPYFAVGWFWYLGTLIPVIGLVQIGAQSHADRYTYIPLIGISVVIAWGADELFTKQHWNRRLLLGVAMAVCTCWAIVSWIQVNYWRDSVALFSHAVEVTSQNYVAYNNLGAALRQQGQLREAIDDFKQAVAIQSDDASADDSLGEALTADGRIEEAIPYLNKAVQLAPGLAKAHSDLGTALLRGGRPAEAESQYRAAIQLDPADAAAQYGLGGVLTMEGREPEAKLQLQQALPLLVAQVEMNPDWVDGHYNLGNVYGLLGQIDQAIVEFSEVIRLRPDDAEARVNLGTALTSRNRLKEASDQFAEATRLIPDNPAAHFSFGRALAGIGRYDDATREYREALRLDPGSPEILRELDAMASQRAR